jgi:hypothetical protein
VSHRGQTHRFGVGQVGQTQSSYSGAMKQVGQSFSGQSTSSGSGHVNSGQGEGVGLLSFGQGGQVGIAAMVVVGDDVVVLVVVGKTGHSNESRLSCSLCSAISNISINEYGKTSCLTDPSGAAASSSA